ncbi:MAG: amidohydrolase [Nesterenkonia sp.]
MTTLLFKNARVFEGEGFSLPRDLSVIGGKIAEEPHADADRIDLQGKFVMPGFIESHAHPGKLGTTLLELDLRPQSVSSVADVVDKVGEATQQVAPGTWIRGSGWDETYFSEGRGPTREDLDAVAQEHPVILTRTCQHMVVVNSAALYASKIAEDAPDPAGGRYVRNSAGAMTGLVQESAMDYIRVPAYSQQDEARAFELAQDALIGWGITTVHDLSTLSSSLRRYNHAEQTSELRLRVRPWLWALDQSAMKGVLDHALGAGISSGFGNDMLRIQGAKFTLDGSVGGRTAAVCCSFEGLDDRGLLYLSDEEVLSQLSRAVQGGLRLAIHGIGERAIEQALGALDKLDEDDFVVSQRTRIEHCALPTESQLKRIQQKNLIAASSIGFIYHLGDSYLSALGPERAGRAYPHSTFNDWGICAPGNSDSPVTNGNPWEGIYAAVTRTTRSGAVLGAEEGISLSQAIKAYTRDAAYTSFEENTLGTLRPGAHADLQILEKNPYELEPSDWLRLSPTAVYTAGKRVLG